MDSCPKELEPYDLGLKLQMKRQDEMNYYNSLYELRAFQVALSQFGAGLAGKSSQAKFYDNPFFKEIDGMESIGNKESKEEIAVFEMKQRANSLKRLGMKESPM